MTRLIAIFLTAAAALSTAGELKDELPRPVDGKVNFARQIEPLFAERCYSCHGSAVQAGGLRLDEKEAALKGGLSGPVILPGDSAHSRIVRLVAGYQVKILMPPAGPRLTDHEVGLLRAWIDQGADWPSQE